MKLEERFSRLRKSLDEWLSSPREDFSNSSGLPEKRGVYIIYDGEKPIYVGSSENLFQRIRGDLLQGDIKHHTLRRKLARNMSSEKGTFPTEDEITSFIQKQLMFQCTVVEDMQTAKRLEHFAIAVLEPEFND